MGPLIYASTTSQEFKENIDVALKRLQHSHLNKFIILYLNIISITNKFSDIDKMVDGNIDILCIAETKLDQSFPKNGLYIGIISLSILDRWLDSIC